MGSLFGKKVRCSHILCNDKETAEEVLANLKNGADFTEEARISRCPSNRNGGDLGKFGRGKMVKEFDDVAFDLEVGQLSGIVQTKFGYHILKRTE